MMMKRFSVDKKNFLELMQIFSSRILIIFFVAITDILISRVMSVNDRGIFSSLQSSIILMSALCTMGLEYGFMLYDKNFLLSSLIKQYKKALFVIIPFCFIVFLFIFWRFDLTNFDLFSVLVILCSEIFTIIFLPLNLQYKSAYYFGIIRIARRMILFFGILFAFILISMHQVSMSLCLNLNAIAWFIGAIISWFGVKNSQNIGHDPAESLWHIWKKGAAMFCAKYAETSQTRIGLLILGFFNFAEEAAYFAVAALTIELSIFIASTLSIGILTKRGGDAIVNGQLLLRLCLIVTIFNVLAGGVVWICVEPVVLYFYGISYFPAISLVRILAPFLVIYGFYPLISTYLIRSNKAQSVVLINCSSLFLNGVLSIILIIFYNIPGSLAASTSLSVGLFFNVFLGSTIFVKEFIMNKLFIKKNYLKNDTFISR